MPLEELHMGIEAINVAGWRLSKFSDSKPDNQ
jgi:hypothetical protein